MSERPCGGDLFRYYYERDAVEDLGASFQELRDEVTIHASEDYVSSTNKVGCSGAAAQSSAPGLVASAGVLVLMVLVARRRLS